MPEDQRRIPSVVRSEQHLRAERGTAAPGKLPITSEGVTYNMAQSIGWVDPDHFAVGRWDGSLTLFRFSESREKGPLIAVAASSPCSEGVQMITWIAPRVFATSNDDRSIAVWSPNAEWSRLELAARLDYDPSFGAANSGEAFLLEDRVVLVVGHAEGFVTIWEGSDSGSGLRLTATVDVRSPMPVNPWGIHNVRGVALVGITEGVAHVATGSEDGDLCLLRIPDGKVVARETYNPRAKRGINAIAAHDGRLLVANCSVGPDDPNLWLFAVDAGRETISLRDSATLRLNPQAEQIFNFAVIWAVCEEGLCFFSSTQEGALWRLLHRCWANLMLREESRERLRELLHHVVVAVVDGPTVSNFEIYARQFDAPHLDAVSRHCASSARMRHLRIENRNIPADLSQCLCSNGFNNSILVFEHLPNPGIEFHRRCHGRSPFELKRGSPRRPLMPSLYSIADRGMFLAFLLDAAAGPCRAHRVPVDRSRRTHEQVSSTKVSVFVSLRARVLPLLVSIPAHPCAARSRASQRRPSLRMRRCPVESNGS